VNWIKNLKAAKDRIKATRVQAGRNNDYLLTILSD